MVLYVGEGVHMKVYSIFKDKKIEDFFNALYIGVHIVDSREVTVLYNNTCEEIEGLKREWLLDKKIRNLVDRGVYNESVALEVLDTKKEVRKTQKVNGKNIFSTGIPIYYNNKLEFVVVSVMDMSSLAKLEFQLTELEEANKLIQTELNIINAMLDSKNPMITKSKEMEQIHNLALRVAKVDSTILIQGESGVGKGVLSSFIHDNSNRKNESFVKIDCSSLPASLIESELFGYEKGAFTGAKSSGKMGLIELSNKGTLFLDEIGDLPLELQVKLLQVIQDKKFQRVGGTEYIHVDTRIIAATNRDLQKMVEEGSFRDDLYYRLNVIPIEIPPLRDRKVDIVPLVKLFLKRLNKKYQTKKRFSSEAMKKLIDYSWPGNIRELENEIERVVVISDTSVIREEEVLFDRVLDGDVRVIESGKSFRENVEKYEIYLMKEYLKESKDINELSDRTGFEASSLRKKAKRLGIELDYGKRN